MKNRKVQLLAMNALIASVYAVLTILISPIAYGALQMRLTEIIVLLACYNKKYIPGLTIGCLLANLASPMGLYDIFFGTTATFIACIGMYYGKNVFLGVLVSIILLISKPCIKILIHRTHQTVVLLRLISGHLHICAF